MPAKAGCRPLLLPADPAPAWPCKLQRTAAAEARGGGSHRENAAKDPAATREANQRDTGPTGAGPELESGRPKGNAGLIPTAGPDSRTDVRMRPGRGSGIDWDNLRHQWSMFLFSCPRVVSRCGARNACGHARCAFGGWMQSVGRLHGGSDGDPFRVNQIVHPMRPALPAAPDF